MTAELPLPEIVEPTGTAVESPRQGPSSPAAEVAQEKESLYIPPSAPCSPVPFSQNYYPDLRGGSLGQSPLGSETPPWLKVPTGLELMSLLSALNRSPLSMSGLPSPLRLCTPQAEASIEQDRNEAARVGIEKALEGLMVISRSHAARIPEWLTS